MPEALELRRGGEYYGRRGVTLATSGFRFTESAYDADECLPTHEHEQPHFCYVIGGRYEETLGRSRRVIRESSSVLFLPSGIPHSELHHVPGRHFMIEASSDRLLGLQHLGTEPLQLPPEESLIFAHRAFREYRNPEPDSEFVLEGLALLLFGGPQKARRLAIPLSSQPGWLRKTQTLLDREYLRPWTLDTLAHEAGIDPEHLTSQFARTFGATPAEYVRKRRIRYACQLMQSTDMPLMEVALAGGFADQGHFTRLFRYYLGVTPLCYLRWTRGLGSRRVLRRLRHAEIGRSDRRELAQE